MQLNALRDDFLVTTARPVATEEKRGPQLADATVESQFSATVFNGPGCGRNLNFGRGSD